jgi:cytochrome c-type biogenesis protein CcmH
MSGRQLSASILLAFLLALGIGAATSYFGAAPQGAGFEQAPHSRSDAGPEGAMVARLRDYAGAIGAHATAPAAVTGTLLPDVDTMIQRLAVRLETAPGDIRGWRMLGWSYSNLGHYEQAAAAYAKAVALDPSSAEVKRLFEDAKAKASGPGEEATKKPQAMRPTEHDAAVRSMVDGLAHRLESSPRDVDGWARVIRSRIVLGEREVAAAAFRKALEVFKDDAAASAKVAAVANELGLKAD